jgi:N-acetylglucosamine-6-phosphate deacetylase
MKTLIKNCRLISPDIEIKNASIYIEDKFIKKIFAGEDDLPEADSVYDAKGKMAFPGFIDIHSHGALGYDATDHKPEAIRTIAESKIKDGVTTYLPTTLTLPFKDLKYSAEMTAEYMKNPTGAKVPGLHLEGPFINPDCVGAQNPDYVIKPDIQKVLKINETAPVKLVAYAVEKDEGLKFTRELVANGITASCGHSAATFADYKKAREAGVKHLTHFCNQMTKLHHREIGLVGAGLYDDGTCIEVICDKIHLCPDMLALIFKVKPIEKIAMITDTMCAARLAPGEYKLGGLEVYIGDDGAARLKKGNNLAGSTLKYYEGLKNVYEITGMPLKKLVKATSWNQARSLGIEKVGKLEPGFYGDITVVNNNFEPQAVFTNGERKL